MGIRKFTRTCIVTAALIAAAGRAEGKPWWWASFSRGDGNNFSNSEWERWHAFFVASIPSNDTAYVTSFAWGSGSIGSIDGINGANDAGLNSHSTAGFPPDYLIGDNTGSNWANAQALSDSDVTDVEDGAGTMHNKDYFGASRGYLISSANHSAGGWRAQNNNAILFFDTAGMSDFMAKVRQEMEEKAKGTFHDNTPYGTINFFSPQGDTVELRFAPDDNDGSLTAGSNSIGGRLATLAANAKESIFYMVDGWSIRGANQLDDKILNNTQAFKAGVAGDVSCGGGTDDWDATVYTNFKTDHTLRCEAGTFNRLHTKTIIFDMEIVATGSPNYTFFAMGSTSGNDEAHVIVHDFRLARRYMAHYHKIMSAATADPSADAYDNTPPNPPTNLAVTPQSDRFDLTWTASSSADVVRYYIFIDTSPIQSRFDIGNFADDDGDGQIDEDPVGDVDGFPSGTTKAGATANDDDADGSTDEDPWMYPEVMVKGRSSTSGTVSSFNVGDSLLAGVNYYFAIVAVDTQGNESTPDTAGPFQLGGPDTKIVVNKNSDLPDTNAPRGGTNVVAASLFVRGDTAGSGDTLSFFAVANDGTADSADVTVKLYRDENEDSAVTIGVDTLVATLSFRAATGRWESSIANDSPADLGAGASAGKTFLVVLDVASTATLGDTWQTRIVANTIGGYSSGSDTGPLSDVTTTQVVTIVSANQLGLAKRGDFADSTVKKGETAVVFTARLSVSQANDTLTAFAVENLGTMLDADVASITLFEDAGSDSALTSADTQIATLPFAGGSIWRNTAISYPFPGTTLDVLVAVRVAPGATGGRTFRAQVPAKEVDTKKADSGPLSAVSTTATFSIPSDTSPDTAVVINEILSSSGGAAGPDHDGDGTTGDVDEEYIEIYNNSDGNVDVGGWDVSDTSAPDVHLPAGVVLGPRQFLIVYRGADPAGNRWYRYDSTGTVVLDSGTYTDTFGALFAPDAATLRNASDVVIDRFEFATETATATFSRVWDGAETWNTSAPLSPGKNSDPTPRFNQPSPNAYFRVTASPTTVNEGDSFTITITATDRDTKTIAAFNRTATLSSDTGTIAPGTTGSFSAGVRSESVSISNVDASGSVVITVRYNTTTSGTVAIQVNNLATVFATVDLEARADESGCTGTLANGVDTYVGVSNASGTITFNQVKTGVYTLTTKEDHHLRRVLTGISISGSDTTIAVGLHRAGDADDDNRINIFDGSITKFQTISGTGFEGNIDGDGVVDDADLQWIRNNFGMVGE